jgi:hypothetical protein
MGEFTEPVSLFASFHHQARAKFDSRMLFVAFEDGSTAVVFAEEMQSIDTGTESPLPFS